MSGRAFGGLELPDTTHRGAVNEYQEPKQMRALHRAEPSTASVAPTNFSQWSEADIIAFLEQRGEDYDDCVDHFALAARAAECEHNTGPAPPPASQAAAPPAAAADSEDDPLDAFMNDNASAAAADADRRAAIAAAPMDTLDDEDRMADYIDAHEAHKTSRAAAAAAARGTAPLDTAGYGSDEEVYAVAQAIDDANAAAGGHTGAPERKDADPLPPIDHSTIAYKPFKRNFYDEHPELFVLDDEEVVAARTAQQMRVTGDDAPKPVSDFAHCGFPQALSDVIAAGGYTAPTPIQAQVLPVCICLHLLQGMETVVMCCCAECQGAPACMAE